MPKLRAIDLAMADVEVAVRLRGEAGHDLRDPPLAHVGGDDLADEIAPFGSGLTLAGDAAAAHQPERLVQCVTLSGRTCDRVHRGKRRRKERVDSVRGSWRSPSAGCSARRGRQALCLFSCDQAKTRYPIVLAHGLARLRRAVRRARVLVRHPERRCASGGANGVRDRGEPAELHRGARRAAHRPGRDDRRHHRQAEGQPDRPQPRRARRALRRRGAARPGGVGDDGRHAAQGRRPRRLPARQRRRTAPSREAVLAVFANSLGTVLGLLSGTSNPQDAIAALDALTAAGWRRSTRSYPQGVPTTACGEGAAVGRTASATTRGAAPAC